MILISVYGNAPLPVPAHFDQGKSAVKSHFLDLEYNYCLFKVLPAPENRSATSNQQKRAGLNTVVVNNTER